MEVLVTGGAGFIGSHVCERLLARGDAVVCIDDFNDYYDPEFKEANLKNCLQNTSFRVYRIDIRDFKSLGKVFKENKIDDVIHLAARAGVRASLKDPKLYFDVNINGTKNLLELAVKYNVKNFIFGSSSSVYGTNKKTPFSEEDEINSQVSPYAESKKKGEGLCREYHNKFGISITCLRFFTVYGPRGRPDMAPYKFVESIISDKPIDIYVSEKEFNNGAMVRDFTFISDIVDGIMLALDKPLGFEVINLGRGHPIKLNEFVSAIESQLNKKAVKKFVGCQEGDVPITYADVSKANKLLGYAPKVPLGEGIKEFIGWYKQTKKF